MINRQFLANTAASLLVCSCIIPTAEKAEAGNAMNNEVPMVNQTNTKAEPKVTGLEYNKVYSFTLKNRGMTDFFSSGYWSYSFSKITELKDVNMTITFQYFTDGTSRFDIEQHVMSDAWKSAVKYPENYRPRNFKVTQKNYLYEPEAFTTYSEFGEKWEMLTVHVGDIYADRPIVYYVDPEFTKVEETRDGVTVSTLNLMPENAIVLNSGDFFIDRDFNVYYNSNDLKAHRNVIAKLQVVK